MRGSKEQRWAGGKGKLQTPEPQHVPEAGRTSVTAMMGDEGNALEKPFESEWKELGFQAPKLRDPICSHSMGTKILG